MSDSRPDAAYTAGKGFRRKHYEAAALRVEWQEDDTEAQIDAMNRVFILSPAYCGGKRAQLLLRPEARFALARLRRR
jgi:hypothetical protein